MMILLNKSRALELANALFDAVTIVGSGANVVNIDRLGDRYVTFSDDVITNDTEIIVMDDNSLYREDHTPNLVNIA